MRLVPFAVLAACALSCGRSASSTSSSSASLTLADEVDALCACTTTACQTAAHTKFAGVDNPADHAPHTLALRAYLEQCDTPLPDGDDLVQMTAMDADMCRCHDGACVNQVTNRYGAATKRLDAEFKSGKKPALQVMELGEHIAKCMSAAIDGPSAR